MTRSLFRRIGAWLFVAAFATGAAAAHHHSLFADLYEGGAIESDHDHVLSSHDPRSHATHFHAILGFEHDACAACHGVRGLGRPAGDAPLCSATSSEGLEIAPTPLRRAQALHAGSSRAPPVSV